MNLTKLRAHTDLAEELMQSATHEQLEEALQILALNLAVYKRKHGEISQAEVLDSLRAGHVDENMAETIGASMSELCGVLRTVMMPGPGDVPN